MDYSETEIALFYLGRVLSSVAYAQYKKGHESKPVLNKINFNGMDADAIVRLSLDLREKTRQYNIHHKTEWNFSEFTERFNEKDWSLSKEQNVFYLMAGYSFGLTKSDNNQ
jgi:CRISPR-associated protein Csh1